MEGFEYIGVYIYRILRFLSRSGRTAGCNPSTTRCGGNPSTTRCGGIHLSASLSSPVSSPIEAIGPELPVRWLLAPIACSDPPACSDHPNPSTTRCGGIAPGRTALRREKSHFPTYIYLYVSISWTCKYFPCGLRSSLLRPLSLLYGSRINVAVRPADRVQSLHNALWRESLHNA